MASHLARQFGFSGSVTGWDVIHYDHCFFVFFLNSINHVSCKL